MIKKIQVNISEKELENELIAIMRLPPPPPSKRPGLRIGLLSAIF